MWPSMLEASTIERIVSVQCTCSNNSREDLVSDIDSGYCSPIPKSESFTGDRTVDECIEMYKSNRSRELRDVDLIELTLRGLIPMHALENILGDYPRAIRIRRSVVSRTPGTRAQGSVETSQLPYKNYDFTGVVGRCAENVIGYMPLPVGVAGPLDIDGVSVYLPMATTEGALIASTSRGCKAINSGGGLRTVVIGDSMTRAPVLSFDNIRQAAIAKQHIESPEGQDELREAFNATTGFGKLIDVMAKMAGRSLYLRFRASTGEAMGMNMIGKATEAALDSLRTKRDFPHMKIVSLSGNYCTDKKPAAINWILGRGKSVVAEAIIHADAVQKVLKCSVPGLVKLNTDKNLIGSALAGMATGGFNAHAANVVTAIFLATGQDPAQNSVSSNCITLMEELDDGSLYATVTMPSIEVGTVGGGTALGPQSAMLDIVGVKRMEDGARDGSNAATLASIIAAGVLAGELSLCAALVTGELIQSHLKYNRKPETVNIES
ncbi:MAG: 3-hydroxy-3-methylglutaryl-coenzyme A (HMG-CoA) reductase isozyme [Claussenomyces sp. TS43310]|nr:MAG: 3-hydroxy-3-methylglutaryl-coenzyme A (HMG-CoA) reductase isozyme [Claussenomyces sp. TS43310]